MDLVIGANIFRNTNGVFLAQERVLIHIEYGNGQLQLTMVLYNPMGIQVAKLERNMWIINDQDRFELTTEPESLMLVDTILKGMVIQVTAYKPQPISVPQATFYLPNGTLSAVTEESWQVGDTLELKGADLDLREGPIEIE